MILAYMHRTGNEPQPDLCLLASKPDQFSVPVSVQSLIPTDGAVLRLGPHEAIVVERADGEGGVEIRPVVPSKMYITPSQSDRPGFEVVAIKVYLTEQGTFFTRFQQDKDKGSSTWRDWNPNATNR